MSTYVGRRVPVQTRGVNPGASLTAFVAFVALVFMNAIQPVFAQYDVGTVATPILHYSFDDETFTNKVDDTLATCIDTCSFVDGKVGGKALSTSNGVLKLSSTPDSIVSAWSVCAWLKADRVDLGWQTALGYWVDGGDKFLHLGLEGYSGRFGEYSSAADVPTGAHYSSSHNYIGTTEFPANTWKHVCILISGGNSGKKELWMDGVLENTISNVGTYGHSSSGSFQLVAGAKSDYGANDWGGSIDDIVVYDSFLSSDDVGALYTRASPCDASGAIANGAPGSGCTSTLADGTTCAPTCDSGYTLSGTRSWPPSSRPSQSSVADGVVLEDDIVRDVVLAERHHLRARARAVVVVEARVVA